MTERILLVDDEAQILRGYRRSLKNRFDLDTASSGQEALERLECDGPYAVVVSDMRMPGMSGLQLLSTLKEMRPDIVRIMLTGNADQKTAVDAVNKGEVFKFLTKPCGPEAMIAALESGLAQYRRIQADREALDQSAHEVQRLREKLSFQTRKDYLTGLANRRAFESGMEEVLRSAREEGKSHTLCYLDLDHFHAINDTCGHFAGDECLRQVGALLSSRQRGGDLVARLAANQFCILLNECPIAEGERIVRAILELFRQYKFEWEEALFDINVSIGLVAVERDSKSVTERASAAENACHVAKEHGGNRLHLGRPDDFELTRRLDESQWVSKINCALRDDRFELYYQTIAPIGDNKETGDHYELLIRMLERDGRIIPPGKFLGAAENHWLSPRIDLWVIRNAVQWLSAHPRQLERLRLCSINLSGHSLGNDEILDFIFRSFDEGSVAPEKICFEITETAAISHLNAAIAFIRRLKARGFRFSLDDFGTGLSSFAYLKNFPVDYLKIDGQFVKQIQESAVDRAMVKSINEIGKVMGKKTIAEFVENGEIQRILESLKVDFAQGYHVAKPMRLADKE